MTRKVHSEGLRERQNMKANSVDHDHDDPKPKKRRDGRLSWCCPHALDIAKEQGKFDDEGNYVGEYDD